MRHPRAVTALLTTVLLAALAAACDTPPPAPAAVLLAVGEDLQAIVDAHPPGTTFVIESGLHRLQHITARDGDRFIGQPGAVLSGARVVEGFTPRGGRWVVGGQPEHPDSDIAGTMEPGWERELNTTDLFLDGQRLRHVATVDEVGPGTYFFDYDTDEIWVGEDPTGRLVELSVIAAAFSGEGTSDVRIVGVEVRQYASPGQHGAIEAAGTRDWVLHDVRAVDNHAAGIRLGDGTRLTDCVVAGNGQIGVVGNQEGEDGAPMVVAGCEIVGNAVLGYDWTWEAGGTKFVGTRGLVFADNVVRDNDGPGVWFDYDNAGAVVIGNEVTGNTINGVFYELSRDGVIAGNTITGNGTDGGPLAAGVMVSNSPRVAVRDNVLRDNGNEIVAVQSHHGSDTEVPRTVTGLSVVGNDVHLSRGFVGLSVTTDEPELYTSAGNRFEANTYELAGCDPCFFWGEPVDRETWQALGNDATGEFR